MDTQASLEAIRSLQPDKFTEKQICKFETDIISGIINTENSGMNIYIWKYPKDCTYLDMLPVLHTIASRCSQNGFKSLEATLGFNGASFVFER